MTRKDLHTHTPLSPCATTKQRVLFLFYEPFQSGISRHIRYILQVLQNEHIEFWILCSSNDKKIPPFFADVIPTDHIKMVPANRFFSVAGVLAARTLIKEQQISTVHIHNLQSALWGYLAIFFSRCNRILYTPHVDSVGKNLGSRWIRSFFTLLGPFTTTFLAVSSSQYHLFKRWNFAPEAKIRCIENHIQPLSDNNSPQHSLDIKQQLGLDEESVLILQAGRLDRQKDPLSLLRVAKRVVNECSNSHFLLIGDGPLQATVNKHLKEQKLTDQVSVRAYSPNLQQLMEQADIITTTSGWEGLPYILLEAASLKKAIVATDIGGHSDLICTEKSGFLAADEKSFAEHLCTLIQSPKKRAEMGENCYRQNRKLFSIREMKGPLSELYMLSKQPTP